MNEEIREIVVSARRRQILDAATRVFARRGFRRATTKEVAREAGISEGTIYNYFEDKDALLSGISNRLNETERRADDFKEGMSSGFREFLVEYVGRRMASMRENREIFRIVLSEMLVNEEMRDGYLREVIAPTMRIAEENLRARMDLAEIRDSDLPVTARFMAGAVLGILLLELLGDDVTSIRPEETSEVIARLLLNGLDVKGDPG